MKIELTREEILKGSYRYPKNFINIYPTSHCIERLDERGKELDFLPSMVRITEDNIWSGRTKNGKRLISIVIRLKYKCSKYLFICFNPWDGFIKTIWFKDANRKEVKKSIKRAI